MHSQMRISDELHFLCTHWPNVIFKMVHTSHCLSLFNGFYELKAKKKDEWKSERKTFVAIFNLVEHIFDRFPRVSFVSIISSFFFSLFTILREIITFLPFLCVSCFGLGFFPVNFMDKVRYGNVMWFMGMRGDF